MDKINIDIIKDLVGENLPSAYGSKFYYNENAKKLKCFTPIDGSELAEIPLSNFDDYEKVIPDIYKTFLRWRILPAPKRGLIIKEIGAEIEKKKDELGYLVTLETGKILEEGKGEIQEIIDLVDYAVGLSRQLSGNTFQSERFEHRMFEQWHPLGIVGVITAFNFPAAVWGWNILIAAVCGNVTLWKPSELTPLTSIALHKITHEVASKHGYPGISALIIDDDASLGKKMAEDSRVPLISATGSCEMGRSVSSVVSQRLGKTILELGGNNAIIIAKDANLDLAIHGTVFGAVGTAGQRCTSTRRLIVHESIKEEVSKRLVAAYKSLNIGNPLDPKTLVGPLINQRAVDNYLQAIEIIKEQGGKILSGGFLFNKAPGNLYVKPTLVDTDKGIDIVNKETFAPILYITQYKDISEAIAINNSVPQGLSSAIFTESLKTAEKFLSAAGSDCGIANINIGTSGAEIGGAFGGEKETGGGRESGSDSWKQYMRRQTNTINYGEDLPLAQGIKFELE